jgi:hypothetical protein
MWYVSEAPQVITLSLRSQKASKEHTCARCLMPIKPGTRYQTEALLVDGVFETIKHHMAFSCEAYYA